MDKLPVAIAYILKNEALFLESSLKSIEPWAQQIIAIDSGSTDSTLSILQAAKERGLPLTITNRPWTDDFAAARNEAFDRCLCPWILFVDGDEILDPQAYEQLQSVIMKTPHHDWYAVIQRHYTADAEMENVSPCTLPSFIDLSPEAKVYLSKTSNLFFFEHWMERLIFLGSERHRQLLRYEGRVHESIIPASERHAFKGERLPVILHHLGRLKPGQQDKLNYYLSLSLQKLKDSRADPAAWIEVFITASELQRFSEIIPRVDEALHLFPQNPAILKVCFQVLLRADCFEKAELVLRRFLSLQPHDLYARGQLTTALLHQGRWNDFEDEAKRLLRDDPSHGVAHTNLAIYYFEKREWKKAKSHLLMAQRIKPFDRFLEVSLQKVDAELQKC